MNEAHFDILPKYEIRTKRIGEQHLERWKLKTFDSDILFLSDVDFNFYVEDVGFKTEYRFKREKRENSPTLINN